MTNPKFTKGQSGNPKGRPAGQTPGAKLRKAIEAHSDDILNIVVESAKSGDMSACKMLLDRFCPSLKPISQMVSVPVMGSLSGQGNEIINAIMTGKIAPDIGSQLISALTSQLKIIEFTELESRISALESKK
jgi:hypothetical protein